jgi:DnaJ-class molecular chaperone
MECAGELLGRSAKLQGIRFRKRRFVDSVPCAYCRGSGVNPKYGKASKCPVCSASGKIKVTPPVVTCLKCSGSGGESGDLTCLARRGTGVVSVRSDGDTCSRCGGTGKEGIFYCSGRKGQGIV